MSPNGSAVGELAKSGSYIKTAAGPYTGFEFTLRPGVKFSDGTPLNAAAVVKYMDWYATQTAGYQGLFGLHPKFTALGSMKVKILLTSPVQNLPSVLSDVGNLWGSIASPACVADPKLFKTQTCGTGPYMLDSAKTVPNTSYPYVPNPNYYDKPAVKYTGVVVSVITQPSAELAALRSGQLNLAYVGADSATAAAAKSAGYSVYSATVGGYELLLNEKKTPALKNPLVRQALSNAINRPALAQLIAKGYSTTTDSFPVSDVPAASVPDQYTYDPAKAKQLLAKAGYGSGLTLKVALIEARTQDQTMFGGLAQELKAVGVELEPVNFTSASSIFDNNAFLETIIAGSTQSQYVAWMSPGNPLATWPTDAHLNGLYASAVKSANPASAWASMLSYEAQQQYYLSICSVSGIWYGPSSLSGLNVTQPRVGAVLVNELSPS